MLIGFLIAVHILVCLALITVILLQRSEGGALGMGGGSGQFMTARGASNLLTRSTSILGGLFFLLSLTLTLLAGGRTSSSVTDRLDIQGLDSSQLAAPPARPAGSTEPATSGLPTGPLPGSASAPAPATIEAPAPTVQAPLPVAPAAPTTTPAAPAAPQP